MDKKIYFDKIKKESGEERAGRREITISYQIG